MKRRILAWITASAMLLTSLSGNAVSAFAEETMDDFTTDTVVETNIPAAADETEPAVNEAEPAAECEETPEQVNVPETEIDPEAIASDIISETADEGEDGLQPDAIEEGEDYEVLPDEPEDADALLPDPEVAEEFGELSAASAADGGTVVTGITLSLKGDPAAQFTYGSDGCLGVDVDEMLEAEVTTTDGTYTIDWDDWTSDSIMLGDEYVVVIRDDTYDTGVAVYARDNDTKEIIDQYMWQYMPDDMEVVYEPFLMGTEGTDDFGQFSEDAITASYPAIDDEVIELTEDSVFTIDTDEAKWFRFTPDEDGDYGIKVSSDQPFEAKGMMLGIQGDDERRFYGVNGSMSYSSNSSGYDRYSLTENRPVYFLIAPERRIGDIEVVVERLSKLTKINLDDAEVNMFDLSLNMGRYFEFLSGTTEYDDNSSSSITFGIRGYSIDDDGNLNSVSGLDAQDASFSVYFRNTDGNNTSITGPGTYTMTASYGDVVSNTATLTVTDAAPDIADLNEGQDMPVTATLESPAYFWVKNTGFGDYYFTVDGSGVDRVNLQLFRKSGNRYEQINGEHYIDLEGNSRITLNLVEDEVYLLRVLLLEDEDPDSEFSGTLSLLQKVDESISEGEEKQLTGDGSLLFTPDENSGYTVRVTFESDENCRLTISEKVDDAGYEYNGGWKQLEYTDYQVYEPSYQFEHGFYAYAGKTYRLDFEYSSGEEVPATVEVFSSDRAGVVNGIYYRIKDGDDDQQEAWIYAYDGTEKDLNIPGEFNGIPVTTIGDRVFEGVESLQTVTLGENIQTLMNSVFSGCSNLKSVVLPSSINIIFGNQFHGCSSLESITVAEGSAYQAVDGMFFHTQTKELLYCYIKANELTIPEGIREIGAYSLDNTGVMILNLPESVQSIWHGPSSMQELHTPNPKFRIDYAGIPSIYNSQTGQYEPAATVYGRPGSPLQAQCEEENIPFVAEGEIYDPAKEPIEIRINGNGGTKTDGQGPAIEEEFVNVLPDESGNRLVNVADNEAFTGWKMRGYKLIGWEWSTGYMDTTYYFFDEEDAIPGVPVVSDPVVNVTEELGFRALWTKEYVENHLELHPDMDIGQESEWDESAWTIPTGKFESLTLKVRAEADDATDLSYRWERFYQDSGRVLGTGTELEIRDSAGGTYRCTVSDQYDNEAYVDFEVEVANRFRAWPEGASLDGEDPQHEEYEDSVTIKANAGDTLQLKVNTQGDDLTRTTYDWYLWDNSIKEFKGRATVEVPAVTGEYSCLVSDGFGNTRWVYFDLLKNEDLTEAPEITEELPVSVELTETVFERFYKFIPDNDAEYRFFSSGSDRGDFCAELLDAEGNKCNSSHWNGSGFELSYMMEAGKTYYVRVFLSGHYAADAAATLTVEERVNNHLVVYPKGAEEYEEDDGSFHHFTNIKMYFDTESEKLLLETIAEADDTSMLTYAWYEETDDDMHRIEGADGSTLEVTARRADYVCIVEDGYGYSESAEFRIRKNNHLVVYPENAEKDEDGEWCNTVSIAAKPGDQVVLRAVVNAADMTGIKYYWNDYYNDEVETSGPEWTVTMPNREYANYELCVEDSYGNYEWAYFNLYQDSKVGIFLNHIDQDGISLLDLIRSEGFTVSLSANPGQSVEIEDLIPGNTTFTDGHYQYTFRGFRGYDGNVITAGDDFTEVDALWDYTVSDHVWDEGVVTKEPKCEEEGEKTYTCTICGEEKTEPVEAKGHTWDEGIVTTEASCTKTGTRTFTCADCKKTRNVDIAALGHEWDTQYTIDTEATVDSVGSASIHCLRCDEKKDAYTIPKKEADQVKPVTDQNEAVDKLAGDIQNAGDAGEVDAAINSYLENLNNSDNSAIISAGVSEQEIKGTTDDGEAVDAGKVVDTTDIKNLTDKIDETLKDQELSGATIGQTLSDTSEIEGEEGSVSVGMSGATAAAADEIRKEAADTSTDDPTGIYQAQVNITDVKKQESGLTFDISLSIVNTVDGTAETVVGEVKQLPAPVTVTMTLPQQYANLKFALTHAADGEHYNPVAFSMKIGDGGLVVITFAVGSLSPFMITMEKADLSGLEAELDKLPTGPDLEYYSEDTQNKVSAARDALADAKQNQILEGDTALQSLKNQIETAKQAVSGEDAAARNELADLLNSVSEEDIAAYADAAQTDLFTEAAGLVQSGTKAVIAAKQNDLSAAITAVKTAKTEAQNAEIGRQKEELSGDLETLQGLEIYLGSEAGASIQAAMESIRAALNETDPTLAAGKIAEAKEKYALAIDAVDQAAAGFVTMQIEALPSNPGLAQKRDVENARAAYNKLSDAAKQYVSRATLDILNRAEQSVKAAEDAANKANKPQVKPSAPPAPTAPAEQITIGKKPSGFKAKAAKKGKVTLTWKHFKTKNKKNKALWKKIKKIEVQYSTDPNFPAGSTTTKMLGKKKTKLVVKKLTAKTTYYFRIRYYDGVGYSNWVTKKVKVK